MLTLGHHVFFFRGIGVKMKRNSHTYAIVISEEV
jgi:hypothetical protein